MGVEAKPKVEPETTTKKNEEKTGASLEDIKTLITETVPGLVVGAMEKANEAEDKKEIISVLSSVEACTLDVATLEKMPMEALKGLATAYAPMVVDVDMAGRIGSFVANEDVEEIKPAPKGLMAEPEGE
jgi:hypothetical protein